MFTQFLDKVVSDQLKKKRNWCPGVQPLRHEPELDSSQFRSRSRPPWASFKPDPIFSLLPPKQKNRIPPETSNAENLVLCVRQRWAQPNADLVFLGFLLRDSTGFCRNGTFFLKQFYRGARTSFFFINFVKFCHTITKKIFKKFLSKKPNLNVLLRTLGTPNRLSTRYSLRPSHIRPTPTLTFSFKSFFEN